MYDNIKIFMDGEEVTPKDGNGQSVEPFIYNGTTYLPVRAVSNAIGKEVSSKKADIIVIYMPLLDTQRTRIYLEHL